MVMEGKTFLFLEIMDRVRQQRRLFCFPRRGSIIRLPRLLPPLWIHLSECLLSPVLLMHTGARSEICVHREQGIQKALKIVFAPVHIDPVKFPALLKPVKFRLCKIWYPPLQHGKRLPVCMRIFRP